MKFPRLVIRSLVVTSLFDLALNLVVVVIFLARLRGHPYAPGSSPRS